MGGESYSTVGSIFRSNVDGSDVECVVPAGKIFTPKELKYDERYDSWSRPQSGCDSWRRCISRCEKKSTARKQCF